MATPAALAQYGPVLAEYTPVAGLARQLAVLGLVFGGIGGCLMVEAASLHFAALGKLIMGGMGVVCFACLAYMAQRIVPYLNRRVVVVPDGLVIVSGNRLDQVRWQDVTSVRQLVARGYRNGFYTGTTHLYWVARANGSQLVFDDRLRNVAALGDTIQQKTLPLLLPPAQATYKRGETVQFGKYTVSPQGLSRGGETIPWHEIQGVKLDDAVLLVNRQGKMLRWIRPGVARIPNIHVLIAMVNGIIGLS